MKSGIMPAGSHYEEGINYLVWHIKPTVPDTQSILYVLALIILQESTLYNLNYEYFLIPQWQDSNMDYHLRKYIDKLSHMIETSQCIRNISVSVMLKC